MPHRRDVFKHAEKLGFGELHFKIDPETQLFAIIAIHNLKRGPALGGCRWRHYDNTGDAIYDALRLARGMTFKSAISHLPHGGGGAERLSGSPHGSDGVAGRAARPGDWELPSLSRCLRRVVVPGAEFV